MERSLWRDYGSVTYKCCRSSPAQSFSGPSPVELATIFYCLRFETSFFVTFYDSQGYGGGIQPRLTPLTLLITFRHEPHRKHRFSCYSPTIPRPLHAYPLQLPSDIPGIVDVFTGRYQATHVPSRDRYITTAIHATVIYSICLSLWLKTCIANNNTTFPQW
jgi:hypothetical protein